MFRVLSSVLLGWALGANDASNVFGTAVSSKMVRYSTAITLAAIFIFLGAILQGREGLKTISTLAEYDLNSAFVISLSAALTATCMTMLRLPISTSQTIVGAILGVTMVSGGAVNVADLTRIFVCWVLTPVGGLVFAILFYYLFYAIFRCLRLRLDQTDLLLRVGLLVAGGYGSYALGANNVANVAGVYVGNLLTADQALLIGGISIVVGVLTYSKRVMATVGRGLVSLDAFSAFVTVIAHAVTVHIYAMIGVPVSATQAIVGAVIGIGIIRNVEAIHLNMVFRVFSGWLFTPVVACLVAAGLMYIIRING